MTRSAILDLIRGGVRKTDRAWAELGAGDGAFTAALRELLGPDAVIYAVDHDRSALKRQQIAARGTADANTRFVQADFTQPLDLASLDGVLLANALHFAKEQTALLRQIRGYLKPTGRLLIVEYEITRRSAYVPYPISFQRLTDVTLTAGFEAPELLATAPSRYWSRMYSALAHVGSRAAAPSRLPQNRPT